MANDKHAGEEPIGWVTVNGIHFPKWKDGTIGWQSGQDDESKITTPNYNKSAGELHQDMKAMATSGRYKTADQLEEAYVDYLSKMPQSKRNELARLSNTGGKGVDRVMAMAGNMANNSGLPVRDRSFKKIQEQNQKLRALAKSNMDQASSKPSSRNAKYDTSRATKKSGKSNNDNPFERRVSNLQNAKENLTMLKAELKKHPNDVHTAYIKKRVKEAEDFYKRLKAGDTSDPRFKPGK